MDTIRDDNEMTKGFVLIEALVVITALLIVVAIGVFIVSSATQR